MQRHWEWFSRPLCWVEMGWWVSYDERSIRLRGLSVIAILFCTQYFVFLLSSCQGPVELFAELAFPPMLVEPV